MMRSRYFRLTVLLLSAAAMTACSKARTDGPAGETATDQAETPETAQETAPAAPDFDAGAVTAFLRDYAEDAGASGDMPTRFAVAGISDTDIVVAYLMGPFWCGSGGCNMLVLRPGEEGYEIIGDTSIVQTPVRALSTSSNGLPDLGVRVSGGGAEAHEALLAFDGSAYPGNPSAPPARPIDDAEGTVLITEDDRGEPLFE